MAADLTLLPHLDTEQLLRTMPSGLFIVDLEMRIVYWNPAAERITGFSAAETLGQHCSFLQGIPCGERCGLYASTVSKPIFGAQCTILGKDGHPIHLLKNIDFLRDAEGKVIGGLELFVDVTRQRDLEKGLRQQAEELESRVTARTAELARSEQRLRAVLDTMDDLAYCADGDYRLTIMNRAMCDLYGDKVGESCHEVIYGNRQPCDWCVLPRVLAGETVREERQLQINDRIYEIIHSPLTGEDGRRQKLAVCRDITDRKRTEQQLVETNRELDAFTHSVSHDLRGVLSPIVTYLDFLSEQYDSLIDPQVGQILDEVGRQCERAIMLVDDLLDLAQVGRMESSDAPPADLVRLIGEVLRDHPREGGTTPEVRIGVLPPMRIPEALVFQVVTNLLGNALRYAGHCDLPVEIGAVEEADRTIYFVRDHGPGVDEKERERIFEIFHRGTASKGTRGTGVGLAIVRKIAQRYQGRVWVEETPGGGATFCFALPRRGAE